MTEFIDLSDDNIYESSNSIMAIIQFLDKKLIEHKDNPLLLNATHGAKEAFIEQLEKHGWTWKIYGDEFESKQRQFLWCEKDQDIPGKDWKYAHVHINANWVD